MLQRVMVVAGAGVLVLAASCGESDSNAAPFHAVPDNAQVVWGSASCHDMDSSTWALNCELDMSDPRVNGTEMIGGYINAGFYGAGRQWIFEHDIITNAEGTWRGSAQGSDARYGTPVGEAHFVGEGRYQGLEFHYYFTTKFGTIEEALLRGWISESTSTDQASSTAPVAPFHTIPVDTTAISGTAACDATGSGAVNPDGELDVLVTCQLDLSDDRVSGTETQDGFRILAGRVGAGDVRVADDARIATTEGTWRGTAQVATDDAAEPTPRGEAHYIGEGAYEGLEFHSYFADLDTESDTVRVHGWISPSGADQAPLNAE